nr:retrotransposon protein, putative, Ty1-copia subclass [Tanacetum cinerariifolium]
MAHMVQYDHLKIPLEDIKAATNNFAHDNCIGKGGFGKVYKGKIIHSAKGEVVVALKRLDPNMGQGNREFQKEIVMLSYCRHENIVSLLGYCDDSGEKILVYEYESKRSLDLYLANKDLNWVQRLKICLGAARGLEYLHAPAETQLRVLHRDIKSGNILLDENWNAKISDFGLSKFGPANEYFSFLVSNAVGTPGYCDPLYVETEFLTKESDVYSFGVVLFEVLCGRVCFGNNHKRQSLVGLARESYEKNIIDEIIFDSIKDDINPDSLYVFTKIAYQCLNSKREERPLMIQIVEALETALKHQEQKCVSAWATRYKVQREVTEETTTAGVWTQLKTLYMTKSLANKLYLKKKLYTFYMSAGRKIFEHIDEFNKMVLDLANVEVKFKDKDLALLLITSLPASYEHFMDTLLYGREDLTLEDVMATLNSKEIKERSKAKGDDGYVKKDEQPSSSGSTYADSENAMRAVYSWVTTRSVKSEVLTREIYRKMQSGKIKVIDGSMVILSGIRRNNCVYSLDGHAKASELNASVEEKDSLAQVWHKRLGHISEARLHVLKKQGLFGKKSLGKLNFCENCILGKSHRVSFGVERHTTQGVIDYVHSDLWDPSQVESLGGKRYFLSIIDDYSRRVWVYILSFKHKAFGKFKEWKQLTENQTGRTVKKLRTDNGLEFYNRKFEQLCIESGIARHLTVSGLPKTFWAEATCTATYLINRSPSTAIEKKTPMGMWSGHLSDYGMLRIFGCVAYPYDKQGKLEPRAIKYVLLGYPKGVKGPEEDHIDQEDGDDKDAGDQETNQPPDLTDYQLVHDGEPRTRTKPLRFRDESNIAAYAFVAAEKKDTHEPLTYQEAVACEDSSRWKVAMKEEMDSLRKNKTWELVDPPAGQNLARLVVHGFTQRAGIDYNEVFSLVVRHTFIHVILALTACKDYELEQLDVKTTFLHGNLEEVIYMKQPPRYEQGNNVCLLNKSLYGLKQSHRQWYKRFDEYMLSNGFKCSSYDNCIYYRNYAPCEYIYLLLYIHDMLIACKNKVKIGSTKSLLKKEFDMKELEEAKKILGMKIVRDQSIQMPLGRHFKLSLKDYPVRDCDVERMSKVPYTNAFGSLIEVDFENLRGNANVGLVYVTDRGNHVDVTCLVDSDYTKDPDKRMSITGYAFLVQRCVVSWKATLQHVVALSTTKAEYMALTKAIKEAIWLRGLLEENHVFHERTKHINVRYDFIKEVLEAKTIKVLKVGTEHNVVDALTKVVPRRKLQHCLELLKCPEAHKTGILNVKVLRTMNLKRSFFDRSHPYVILKLTESSLPCAKKTKAKHIVNPEWNEEFSFYVDNIDVQRLNIWVLDAASGKRHNIVGMASLLLANLIPEYQELHDLYIFNVEYSSSIMGNIVIEVVFKPLAHDKIPYTQIEYTSAVHKALARTPKGGGVLVVIVHEARSLQGKNHMNPSVSMLFRGMSRKTKTMMNNKDPIWEEVLTFMSKQPPINETLHLKVISTPTMRFIHSEELIAQTDISLADVVNNKRIIHTYIFQNGMSQLDVEFQWRTYGDNKLKTEN